MAGRDGREPLKVIELEAEPGARMSRPWSGPRTVAVQRAAGGFGFTLRHFIVYPPESAMQQLQEEELSCETQDGGQRKRSKLSALDPMDTIFVKQVKDSGPAHSAGLQKGDRIVSVNGESVTGKSYSQVIALIQSCDSTLKLLVVPKDEDILQMAYESSAYNPGKEPYRGRALEIPHPPQLYPPGGDPPPPSNNNTTGPILHQATRFKSEIHMVPENSDQKVFDPHVPRLSSASSYSTSKDVGNMSSASYPQPMDCSGGDLLDDGFPPGEAASSGSRLSKSYNHSTSSSTNPGGCASFTARDLSAAAAAAGVSSSTNPSTNLSSGRPYLGSALPPTARSTASARACFFQRSRNNSQEHLNDSSSSSSSPTVAHHYNHRHLGAGQQEKLLMTSHERQRRSSKDQRHLVTYLPPGASTTITVTPRNSTSITSTTPHQWPSEHRHRDSLNRTGDSLNRTGDSLNRTHDSSLSDQNLSTTGDDTYGLTVSLHVDTPRSQRHASTGNPPMINMVTERLRKFESAESVDSAGRKLSTSSQKRVGYDSVMSRAAEFEQRCRDDTRSEEDLTCRRIRRFSPHSTPSGSTSSLPQAGPPQDSHKVPPTPPATINFYFRDPSKPHNSMASLEPSPEMRSPDFRMRVGSEPPQMTHQRDIGRERSPLVTFSLGPETSYEATRGRHKPSARQPSYMAAVSASSGSVDFLSPPEYYYPTFKAATLPLSQSRTNQGQGHRQGDRSPLRYPSNQRRLISEFHTVLTDPVASASTSHLSSTPTGRTKANTVTLRERSRSEDREARLVRRTSYLMATGRQNNAQQQFPGKVDVSQLDVPPPPAMPSTGEFSSKSSRARLNLPLRQLDTMPEVSESPLTPVTPGSRSSPGSRSPMTPLTPTSPQLIHNMDIVTTPTKTSNIKKLKSLFGERTPRILEAITDKKYDKVFELPSPVEGIVLDGSLACKVAVTDGKRASDRSWKPAYAQLRGQALYLFRDKNNLSPTLYEDQPISILSSIVDIAYDYTKKKHVFRLTTYNGSEYLLQADDHDSMLSWIRVIQANSNSGTATTSDPAIPVTTTCQVDGNALGGHHGDQGLSNNGSNTHHTVALTQPDPTTSEHLVRKTNAQLLQEVPLPTSIRTSPQVAPKGKKTSTRSLRSKSPHANAQSPGSKPKKQLTEKDHMDPSGPKGKDAKTWKDRMAKKFKRYGSSSSTSADIPETSENTEVTGTFSVPLESCMPSSFSEFVPHVVEVCTRIVEDNGLENQGIYRVPGNTGAVNCLLEEFNKACETGSLDMENEKWQDINVVTSLLKLFFRKLPEPLITEELYQSVIHANRTSNQEKRMLKIKKLLHDLPEHNFETFHYLAEHLSRVADKGDLNKMDGRNLAIVFGPTLIRASDDNMITMVTDMSDQCRIVESIISNCKWFFSSWSEDVNVPVEITTDTVPVSGMNEELLVKAENLELGERGRDVSVKDLMSSVIQAANRKITRKPKDHKPKGSESIDIDIESDPASFNERNIDREIELRKGKDTSMTSMSSSLVVTSSKDSRSLEQSSSIATALSCSMPVQDSKSSLSLDQARDHSSHTSSIKAASSSSLAVYSGLPPPQPMSRSSVSPKHTTAPVVKKTSTDKTDSAPPIKRYPAYPRVDISSPQTDNSKPTLRKKYSSEELNRGDSRRETNDEVKKTYGLTTQTRLHLRRIELETRALKKREEEKQRDQEKHALAKKRIELELQKTRKELEDENLDELLASSAASRNMSGKITDMRQQYSDYINSSMDSRSVTSDYSTMSSCNLPAYAGPGASGATAGDYSPVRVSASVPRELCYSSPKHRPKSTHDDLDVKRPHRGNTFDAASTRDAKLAADDKARKGSLDSLLDIIDHDESVDTSKEEGLLESIASAGPHFKLLSSSGAAPRHKHADGSRISHRQTTDLAGRPHKTDALLSDRPFRDPSLHKSSLQSRDAKVVGIASRFERKDKSLPCYSSDSRLSGGGVGPASRLSTGKHSKENQAPAMSKGFSTGAGSAHRNMSEQPRSIPNKPAGSSNNKKPGDVAGRGGQPAANQPSGPQRSLSSPNQEQYTSDLRRSTEKLFHGGGQEVDKAARPKREPLADTTSSYSPQMRRKSTRDARKSKRRRFTVGGPDDLEHFKALLLATEQNRPGGPGGSACDRLQPASATTPPMGLAEIADLQAWCLDQQRQRGHTGSTPTLHEPATATPRPGEEEPPVKRKGSVKQTKSSSSSSGPSSRSGSCRSHHSSSPSPSSPGPGAAARGFGFVSTV